MARKSALANRKRNPAPPTFGAAKAPMRSGRPLMPLKGLAQGMRNPTGAGAPAPMRVNPRRGAKKY